MHHTFDNLYPLNHAFYGSMDLFALQNLRNVELSLDVVLPHRARVRVAYQHFALPEPVTDAWYNAAAGAVYLAGDPGISSVVGSEVDVTVRLPVWHVAMEAGYSHFFGGAYLDDAAFALRSADFLYLQTMVGF
ncbi:MAG: alginate export family protein [Acidobacteria bacterium]|nr:alginate export family protein [Acidobacteriota bacterium]